MMVWADVCTLYIPENVHLSKDENHQCRRNACRFDIKRHPQRHTCIRNVNLVYLDLVFRPKSPKRGILTPISQAHLLLLNPGQNPNKRDDCSHNHRPQLNMQRYLVIIRLRGRRHRRKCQYQQHISAHTMVLVDRLGVIHATIEAREVVLRYTYQCLQHEKNIRNQPQNRVRRDEMPVSAIGDFVVLDDDEAGEEGEDGGDVQDGVDVCALMFLLGGMRRLEDEDGLGSKEDAGGVKERVCGEDVERVEEDAGPDGGGKLWGVSFGVGRWKGRHERSRCRLGLLLRCLGLPSVTHCAASPN